MWRLRGECDSEGWLSRVIEGVRGECDSEGWLSK